jgi:hypothetical protein
VKIMDAIQTVITGTAKLVIFAIAVLLGLIAICAVADGGIRRKRK